MNTVIPDLPSQIGECASGLGFTPAGSEALAIGSREREHDPRWPRR